jgi:hypothetical protein
MSSVGPDVLAELRAVASRLSVDPADVHGLGALTACDACPDNNVETPQERPAIDCVTRTSCVLRKTLFMMAP